MKRYILYIGWLLCLLTGCTDKDLVKCGSVGDKEVWTTLKFGHTSFNKIDISTRATLNEIAESRVENLFVYIFDADGNRLYSHYYDYTNRKDALPTTPGNWWTVNNRTSSNNNDTRGEVMIKAPVMTNGSIYMIANLNADQLNISSDQLNLVETLADLEALTITMNQEITSRTGYFLMTGSADGISVDDKGNIKKGNTSLVSIPLVRLDAKVTVKVKVGASSIDGQSMQAFIPESWQIMKLPKGTRLLAGSNDADELGYFNSPVEHFEKDEDDEKGFSFYMLENMEDTKGLTSFNQRDLRSKKPDGSYDTTNGLWEYASEDATYMVIKGKVQMEVDTDDEFGMQYLEADVTYYVHLGNFGNSKTGGSYNDFTINRNTHYTYTITISGVNNIELEVTTDKENQSGATGHVYKSREENYTFDAHYGQRVFRIDAETVLDKTITWYIKTPFGEGTPGMESGTQVPNLDYRWVWFMVNGTETSGVYSTNNRTYPGNQFQAVNYKDPNSKPDELMNVVEFTNFIRVEKQKLKDAAEDEKATASAFKKDNNGKYCLYVTAFVDEYYYEADPLNAANSPQDLWKKFVNQPNRIMHILCDSKLSKDEESSVTNSVITIRQRSIQTPYNLEKERLMTAWGCESVDEFENSQLFFYDNTKESMTAGAGSNLGDNIGTPSDVNGLYNSVKIWGVNPGTTRWDTYIDYERVNDYQTTIKNTRLTTYFMEDKYAVLRYATLMRNRDNDGDGVIDADELRWYVASLNQLYDLYMGQLGLNRDAALYTPTIAARSNYTSGPYSGASGWRNHVISSTWEGSTPQPTVLWAEEGISRSPYASRYSKPAPYSIRCVRNLGLSETPDVTKEGMEGINYPTRLVKVTEPTNTHGYLFDLSNINTKSLRYFTSRELQLGNENEETARVYYGFETGVKITYPRTDQGGNNNVRNYAALKEALEAGTDIGCDTENGFRVPNVREGALMSLYCNQNWWTNSGSSIMTSTWYSNGGLGNQNDAGYTSWQFSYRYATVGGNGVTNIMTVRDWYPTD